ncbi:DUF805 domain-containing protein [Leucobacter viscericola]|uniref:DUF805 domain-containing protein n=1 Tax=Leucobacter viscericola TaxID=2714935 RepID=A0A6G7XI70_9MICO|nr:DUF805 domain-containing protein [Leucobacter viscericola]QIK64176.1 DUF805 domain-containing protein [Leucobacter viscericola]
MSNVAFIRKAALSTRHSWSRAMGAFFENAYRLRGRASRSEYWWWMGTNVLVLLLLWVVIPLLSGASVGRPLRVGPFGSAIFADVSLFEIVTEPGVHTLAGDVCAWLSAVWIVLTLLPGITVLVRRLHDSGLSGWWGWLAIVPFGQVVVLILALRRSRPTSPNGSGFTVASSQSA